MNGYVVVVLAFAAEALLSWALRRWPASVSSEGEVPVR